jgi:hypothetical protein
VQINFGAGRASLHVSDLAIGDFHNGVNALTGGSSVPATVTIDIRWSGATERMKIEDEANDFGGQFILNTATIEWSATQDGFEFISDPADTSISHFAEIGKERNGVFFP